jgi:mono/diheme cytochrome c family protein
MVACRNCAAVLVGLCLPAIPSAGALGAPPPGECPQPRFTGKAPADYYERKNPVAPGKEALAAAERTYRGSEASASCAACHGRKGDGKGRLADLFTPRPRNFACAQTIEGVPDGQLFWIIRFGSPETAMPPHPQLSDTEIWQLVNYLRTLAR